MTYIETALLPLKTSVSIHQYIYSPLKVKIILLYNFSYSTVSDTFHMEECLIGGYKVGQFTVKNTGGTGRFCIMPTSSWPAANFKVSCLHDNTVLVI